jgi:8-oxo-dGTP pyrophosphatase MutT (NUDIX family)
MHAYDVLSSDTVFSGRVVSLRRDIVAMPGGGSSPRDVVVHPGAVGVVALDGDRVLMVNQYRHPVGRRLDEIPAGLLDVDGEPGLAAAQRELVEEAGYEAATWNVLVDVFTSPGMTNEAIRIYLARDVRPCTRDVQEHEELEMTAHWVALGEAVNAALDGSLENAVAVIGVLAASEAVRRDFDGLRPANAPWRARPAAVPGP